MSEAEIQAVLDDGYEHNTDNQNRMEIQRLVAEGEFSDLETMVNNKNSTSRMDDSELSEIEKSKLGVELEWNCDLDSMLENLLESHFFDFRESATLFNKFIEEERARKNVYYKKYSAKELQQRWKDIECSKFREEASTGVSTNTINLDSSDSVDNHPYRHIGNLETSGAPENEYFKPDFMRNDKLFAKKATNLFLETDATNGLCDLD